MVIVECANEPIAFELEGLMRLYSLVSWVRAEYCNDAGVPNIGDFTVIQWHYGRDTKGSIEGADFALSFKDRVGNLARVYSRHDGMVRAERVENPNLKFAALLGIEKAPQPLNRGNRGLARFYDL
jgi:hypothetical protein